VRWLWLAALIGCGRVGFGSVTGDGGDDGAGATDAVDALVTNTGICPPTVALSDDFNASTMSPIWTEAIGTNMTIAQTGGFLEIAFGAGTTPSGTTSNYTQATAIDYTEACVTIELDMIPSTAAMGRMIFIVGNSGAFVTFEEDSGTLYSNRKGGLLDTRPYDAVAHKFLRLRHHTGTWYWEASPDDVTYTAITSIAANIVPTPTTVSLQLAAVGGTQNGGMAQFNSALVLVP
jgi:hypothetical protein